MDMDIRSVILNNMKGKSKEEIRGFIQDAVDKKEELALPGMGILFETMWQKSSEEQKNTLMEWLVKAI
jgi:small acid-soluble spore protein I (minor)